MSTQRHYGDRHRPGHEHDEPSAKPIVVTTIALCAAFLLMVMIWLTATGRIG